MCILIDLMKYRLTVIGDENTRKTEALISYTTNKFRSEYVPTVFETSGAMVMWVYNRLY